MEKNKENFEDYLTYLVNELCMVTGIEPELNIEVQPELYTAMCKILDEKYKRKFVSEDNQKDPEIELYLTIGKVIIRSAAK